MEIKIFTSPAMPYVKSNGEVKNLLIENWAIQLEDGECLYGAHYKKDILKHLTLRQIKTIAKN